jgi:hypothetical protein
VENHIGGAVARQLVSDETIIEPVLESCRAIVSAGIYTLRLVEIVPNAGRCLFTFAILDGAARGECISMVARGDVDGFPSTNALTGICDAMGVNLPGDLDGVMDLPRTPFEAGVLAGGRHGYTIEPARLVRSMIEKRKGDRAARDNVVPFQRSEPAPPANDAFGDRATASAVPRVEREPIANEAAIKLPGILGTIAQWTTGSARSPQVLLSPLAALSFCASVLGNGWRGPTGLAANLYLAGIATTGGGKDHILRTPAALLHACGLGARIGGSSIASGAAVVSRLIDCPNTFWALDEWGHYLRAMADPRTGGHLREAATYFLQLSGPLHPHFSGKDYADRRARETKSAAYPCVNLLGVTTPDVYYESLTTDQIRDGFLGRMIVVETYGKPKKNRDAKSADPPASAIEWAARVRKPNPGAPDLVGCTPSSPRLVDYADGRVKRFLDEFDDEAEAEYARLARAGGGLEHLVVRWHEQALKLALVAAAAIDPDEPRITLEAAEWAAVFVDYHGRRAIKTIGERVTESKFERAVNEVYAAILKAGRDGLTLREMSSSARALRCPTKERNEYLARLIDDEKIIRTVVGSRQVFVAIEHV